MSKPAAKTLPDDLTSDSSRSSWYQKLVHKGFASIKKGFLEVSDGSGKQSFGNPDSPLRAGLQVHRPSCYGDIVFGGSVGAAEAYMRGDWSSPNLTNLIEVMAANMPVVGKLEAGFASLIQPLRRGIHRLRKNTKAGSRKNIAAHYDLSNEFFKLMLDPTMMYSCAFFEMDSTPLHQASLEKLDRICRKLDLGPQDRVVEIGTGWGGFAIYAAKTFGCHVTTTTISKQQHAHAQEMIAHAGLEDRITLLFEDYRDLEGRFDKLVSIEMVEAVGHHFLPTYLKTCAKLLKPNGTMLIQAITIPDDRYHAALKEVDFIKKFIFPGSFIPSVGALSGAAAKHTDLRLSHLEDQTHHYALTIARWHENFRNAIHKLPDHLNNQAFKNMWHFYLAYCEGGFRQRVIGSAQLMFSKPDSLLQTPLIRYNAGR